MHQIALAKDKKRFYKPKISANFIRNIDDPKLVAIYLPQFHTFDLNNKAWGTGFTEWTNVTKGQPRFVGHIQPLLPSDLGFYDLERPEKIKEQIDLAKKYGIYGFQIYYYWFSGEKIMDKPINSILEHPEWDFNFSICWAYVYWSKRWYVSEDEVIIAQKYRKEDPINFIKDVAQILNDKRYITQDGKPILSVYRTTHLDDPKRYAEVWREYFKDKFGKELYLIAVNSFNDDDPRTYGFDAAMDFMPMSVGVKSKRTKRKIPTIDVSDKLLDVHFRGTVFDLQKIIMDQTLDAKDFYPFPAIPCISPSWDNDARRKGKGSGVYYGNNPNIYETWLSRIIKKELDSGKKSPIIFINAWNEWGEGAMLEPTLHYGHAILRKTAEALSKYSNNKVNKINFESNNVNDKFKKKTKND
jgi:lipopolysaccharide biosynthesis protein